MPRTAPHRYRPGTVSISGGSKLFQQRSLEGVIAAINECKMNPHKFPRGHRVDLETRLQMISGDLSIPKLAFQRLVREVAKDLGHPQMRFKAESMEALQYVSEGYLTEVFDDAKVYARHAGRTTVLKKDWNLAVSMSSKRAHRPNTN